jgi:hypothetical protein
VGVLEFDALPISAHQSHVNGAGSRVPHLVHSSRDGPRVPRSLRSSACSKAAWRAASKRPLGSKRKPWTGLTRQPSWTSCDSADDPASGSCIHGERESRPADLILTGLPLRNEGRHIPRPDNSSPLSPQQPRRRRSCFSSLPARSRSRASPQSRWRGARWFVKAALLDGPCRLAAAPQNRASGSARTGRSLPRGEAAVRPCSIPAWLSAAFTRAVVAGIRWPACNGLAPGDSASARSCLRRPADQQAPELDGSAAASFREGARTPADSATPATAPERFSAGAARGGSVRGTVHASDVCLPGSSSTAYE